MQRYFGIEKQGNTIKLNANDFNHIKNVMRMKENDKIFVVYEKISYVCKLNGDLISAEIIEKKNNDLSFFEVILFVPILVEEKMDLILQKATELGISKIIPVDMNRCKFKISQEKQDKKILRWNTIVKEASEQSHRNSIPEVTKIISLKAIEKCNGVNIVCSTDNQNVNSVKKVLNNVKSNDIIQVVFGPEGGITSEEEQCLVNKGFTKTTFGNRILRTETVPIYILSILNYVYERE